MENFNVVKASFNLIPGSIYYHGSNEDDNTVQKRFSTGVELKLFSFDQETKVINFQQAFTFSKEKGDNKVTWVDSQDLEYFGIVDGKPYLYTLDTKDPTAVQTEALIAEHLNDEVQKHLVKQLLEYVKGVL